MSRPQTIQIYLPSGDPRGMRVAEITTRIVRVVEIPRSQLADFLKLPESQQVGVYFLVGELSETGLPRAYIGQSGNVGARLVQHNQGKDFWNRAFAVISLTNSLTQTHALFLEWFAIQQATNAARYYLENGNAGSQPYTPAPLQADCHEIHETAATLLATLGQPIFEPLVGTAIVNRETSPDAEVFFCKGSGADARGEYTAEGFVVLRGSKARTESATSFAGTSGARLRDKLIAQGVMQFEAVGLVFSRDFLFPSPSAASDVLTGRNSNGWKEWKSAQGETLDQLKRQAVSASE